MPLRPRRSAASAGFTLVELLIVVAILAILSVVALPQLSSERSEAVASALKANVMHITMVLEVEHQKGNGWPDTIEAAWFTGSMLPLHPDNLAGVPTIEVVKSPGLAHPRNKILVSNSPGAYWYNASEGILRARVKDQGSLGETLALYNAVNQCQLASLADTSGALTGSGSETSGSTGSDSSGSSGSGTSGSGSTISGRAGSGRALPGG